MKISIMISIYFIIIKLFIINYHEKNTFLTYLWLLFPYYDLNILFVYYYFYLKIFNYTYFNYYFFNHLSSITNTIQIVDNFVYHIILLYLIHLLNSHFYLF